MGNLYVLRGEPDRALPYLQRGLDEAKAANLTPEAARLAGNLASVDDRPAALGRGRALQPGGAATLAGHAILRRPSITCLNSAQIALGRDQLDEAARLFAEVLATPGSPPSVLWDAHFDLAEVALARKQPDRAAAEFEAALTIVETTRAGLLRTDDKVVVPDPAHLVLSGVCVRADRTGTDRSRARGRRLEPRSAARRASEDVGARPGQGGGLSARRPRIGCGPAVVLARAGAVVALGDFSSRRAAAAAAAGEGDRNAGAPASVGDRRRDGRSARREPHGRRQAVSDAGRAGGAVDSRRTRA